MVSGEIHGRIIVERIETRGTKHKIIHCLCVCGKRFTVTGYRFKKDKRRSCGEPGCRAANVSWVGITSDGYKKTIIDGRQKLIHRLVVEENLGRKLNPSEVVHHINGVKTDNRLLNLAVQDRSDHSRMHKDVIAEVNSLKRENALLRNELKRLRASKTGA
jgi:hypothetical protein